MTGTMVSSSWRSTRARIAQHAKTHPGEKPPDDLYRDHVAARLEDHVRRVVDGFPPLTRDQRHKLAVLLAPAPAVHGEVGVVARSVGGDAQ